MDEEKKPRRQPKGYKPIGSQFLDGLPKRYLTLEEWREYPDKLKKLALKLGIYEVDYD